MHVAELSEITLKSCVFKNSVIFNLTPRIWERSYLALWRFSVATGNPLEYGTWRISSCAQAMPSECSRRKSFRGSIRRLITMELIKRELEQLSRHVTDIICTAKSVKRYVVPEGEEGKKVVRDQVYPSHIQSLLSSG